MNELEKEIEGTFVCVVCGERYSNDFEMLLRRSEGRKVCEGCDDVNRERLGLLWRGQKQDKKTALAQRKLELDLDLGMEESKEKQ